MALLLSLQTLLAALILQPANPVWLMILMTIVTAAILIKAFGNSNSD